MDADRYNQIVGSVLERDELFLSPQSLLATRWLVEPGVSDKYVPADAVRMLALVPYVRYDGKRTLRYTEHKLQYDALTGSAVIDQRSQLAVLDADYCGKRQRKRWQCDHTMRYAQHVVHMMEALLRAADGNFFLHESPPLPAMYLVEDQRRPLQPEIGNRFLRGAAIDRYGLEDGVQPTHEQQRESFYQYGVDTPRGRAYPQVLFYRSLNKTYEYCPATGTAHPPVAPSAGTTIGNWMTYGSRWIPKAQLPRLTLLDMASSNLFMNEFQNPAVRLLQQFKFLPPGETITQEDIDGAIHALDALIDGPLAVWREAELVARTGRINEDDIARVGRLLTAHPQLRAQLTENFRAKFAMESPDEYPNPMVAQQDIDASIMHPTRRMSILAQLYDTFRAEAVAADPEVGHQLSMAEILKALRNPLSPGVASGLPTTQVVQLRGYAAKETLAWIEPWSVLDLGSMYKFEEQYVPSDYHSVKKGTHAKSGKSPARIYDGARG